MFERERRYSKNILVFVIAGAILIGCAAPSGRVAPASTSDNNRTAAQQDFYRKADNYDKTIWGGVATGAVLGGLLGFAISGDATGALIGAGTGAVAGGVAGSYVASKQRDYANQEAALDSMISDIRGRNADTKALVDSMALLVEEDKQKLASLRQQHSAKQIDDATYRQQLAQIQSDKEVMRRVVAEADEQLGVFREAGQIYARSNADADMSPYNTEVSSMESKIDQMRALVDDLSAEELG